MTVSSDEIFWDRGRLRRTLSASYLALVFALLWQVFFATTVSPFLDSGDFPGFYAPAVILHEGQPEKLYDLHYQREVEGRYWNDFKESFYIFAYPPYVAQVLKPLANFSAPTAKTIFILIHLLAAVLALSLLISLYGLRYESFFLSFLFPPLLISIFGAQNTALTLFFYVLFLYGVRMKSFQGDLLSGFSSGLMLFKPQFGVFFCLYLLVARRWAGCLGVALASSLWYLMAAATFGWDWPLWWLTAVTDFGGKNYEINAHQMISLAGGLYSLGDLFSMSAADVGKKVGIFLSIVCIVLFYYRRWRASVDEMNEDSIIGTLGFLAVVLSPQTLIYDLGICLVPIVSILRKEDDKSIFQYLSLLFVLIVSYLLRNSFAFSLPFLSACYAYWLFSRAKVSSDQSAAAH